jgi:hypothetical protein
MTPLKMFFALAIVEKPRGGGGGYERFTSDGKSVSSLAAELQKSAEFLCALYICHGVGDRVRGQRFVEVEEMRHGRTAGATAGTFLSMMLRASKDATRAGLTGTRVDDCIEASHGLCFSVNGVCFPLGRVGACVERAVGTFHVELRKLLGAGDDAAVYCFIRAVSEVPTGGDADDLA